MIIPLFSRLTKGALAALGAIFSIMALYITSIIYMFNPKTAKMLNDLKAAMPEVYDAFGMGNDASTLTGFAFNYLYGFILTLLPLILIILLANRFYVKSQSTGETSYILASPHSRLSLGTTYVAASSVALAILLVLVTATELALMQAMYPSELDSRAIIMANMGLGALWLFMMGVCTLSAVSFNHPGCALWVGGGYCLASYVLTMASQTGDGLEWLGNLSCYGLYDCYGLGAGQDGAWLGVIALAVGAVLMHALALFIFNRRDFAL